MADAARVGHHGRDLAPPAELGAQRVGCSGGCGKRAEGTGGLVGRKGSEGVLLGRRQAWGRAAARLRRASDKGRGDASPAELSTRHHNAGWRCESLRRVSLTTCSGPPTASARNSGASMPFCVGITSVRGPSCVGFGRVRGGTVPAIETCRRTAAKAPCGRVRLRLRAEAGPQPPGCRAASRTRLLTAGMSLNCQVLRPTRTRSTVPMELTSSGPTIEAKALGCGEEH